MPLFFCVAHPKISRIQLILSQTKSKAFGNFPYENCFRYSGKTLPIRITKLLDIHTSRASLFFCVAHPKISRIQLILSQTKSKAFGNFPHENCFRYSGKTLPLRITKLLKSESLVTLSFFCVARPKISRIQLILSQTKSKAFGNFSQEKIAFVIQAIPCRQE